MINRLQDNYTVVMNKVLNDKNMSLKAKGLYAFLCSKPSEWNFSYDGLTHQLKEGEKSIRSGIKELVEHGLLIRVPKKNKEGEFKGWNWILHPTEEDLERFTDPTNYERNASYGSSRYGNYHDGNDHDGNYQNGNHLSNTIKVINKSNKEKNNKSIVSYNKEDNYSNKYTYKESEQKNFANTQWTKSKSDLKIFEDLLNNEKYNLLKSKLNIDDEFVKSIILYRRRIKKPFKTVNGPLRVLKDILECFTAHRLPVQKILDMMMEREWQSIRPDYSCFKSSNSPKNAIQQGEEMLRRWQQKNQNGS